MVSSVISHPPCFERAVEDKSVRSASSNLTTLTEDPPPAGRITINSRVFRSEIKGSSNVLEQILTHEQVEQEEDRIDTAVREVDTVPTDERRAEKAAVTEREPPVPTIKEEQTVDEKPIEEVVEAPEIQMVTSGRSMKSTKSAKSVQSQKSSRSIKSAMSQKSAKSTKSTKSVRTSVSIKSDRSQAQDDLKSVKSTGSFKSIAKSVAKSIKSAVSTKSSKSEAKSVKSTKSSAASVKSAARSVKSNTKATTEQETKSGQILVVADANPSTVQTHEETQAREMPCAEGPKVEEKAAKAEDCPVEETPVIEAELETKLEDVPLSEEPKTEEAPVSEERSVDEVAMGVVDGALKAVEDLLGACKSDIVAEGLPTVAEEPQVEERELAEEATETLETDKFESVEREAPIRKHEDPMTFCGACLESMSCGIVSLQ